MPLQLSHCIIVIRFQRQVAVLGITLEEPSDLEESRIRPPCKVRVQGAW